MGANHWLSIQSRKQQKLRIEPHNSSNSLNLKRKFKSLFKKKRKKRYVIHWDFKEFFIMVDGDKNVITSSHYQNATELEGDYMAERTLRTLNIFISPEKGKAQISELKDIKAMFEDDVVDDTSQAEN
jgi:hypothetical protein